MASTFTDASPLKSIDNRFLRIFETDYQERKLANIPEHSQLIRMKSRKLVTKRSGAWKGSRARTRSGGEEERRNSTQKKRSRFLRNVSMTAGTSIAPVAAAESTGPDVDRDREKLVTGNEKDVLDLVPHFACDDDPNSDVRVVNGRQNNLSNALDLERPYREGRKTAVLTSEETFADRTLKGSHSGQETVSN